jgi:gliding motility-associated-like protein
VKLLLDAKNSGSTYTWQDKSNNQTFLVEKPGNYFVTVNSNNCISKDSILISYKLKPVFTLGNDFSICSGELITLKPTIQANQHLNYLWQDGTNDPTYTVINPGDYILNITNDCGTIADTVVVIKGVCELYVPNAFTPNGDNLNDVFRANYGENITRFKMEVYNRWGEKVFESGDIRKGWNGSYRQNVLPGVYVWMIKFDTVDRKSQMMKGTVVLIK